MGEDTARSSLGQWKNGRQQVAENRIQNDGIQPQEKLIS